MPPDYEIEDEIQKFLRELDYILNTKSQIESISQKCRQLQDNSEHVLSQLFTAITRLKERYRVIMYDPVFSSMLGDDTRYDLEDDIRQLQRHILRLKLPRGPKWQPSYYDAKHLENMLNVLHKSTDESTDQYVRDTHVPVFFRNPAFENSAAFRDAEGRYDALSINLKLCLLCFSVFPVGAIIKKRLMVYWWIAEGFIETEGNEKDLEQLGAQYFYELMEKDFLKPYYDKRRLEVQTCKMPTFIHSVVTTIAARAKFFDFDSIGRPRADCPSSFRLALDRSPQLECYKGYEKFHLVFNLSANVLCLSLEWISTMKNVTVLYLGRWQSYANHSIHVVDDLFLTVINNMKHLRLLSLQGILGIMELPDEVTELKHLIILDLRACIRLQKLPRDIGLLKSLTHLDLSECELISMPKGLSKIKNLIVLKGFLVGEPSKHTCSLRDLSELPKLRKLSILTRLRKFPEEDDLKAFQLLAGLTKLKIEWRRLWKQIRGNNNQMQKQLPARLQKTEVQSVPEKTTPDYMNPMKKYLNNLCGVEELDNNQMQNNDADCPQLPAQLQKLELRCFPMRTAPHWLNPVKLKKLEKLYITASELCDLCGNIGGWNGPVNPWGVKVLRLKYMTCLAMQWKEVLKLFPELIYLENVNCPKLSFFPCDEAGVWINKKKVQSSN
ncbi:hypothetical protein ACET3Z_022499 [Daucus carota]